METIIRVKKSEIDKIIKQLPADPQRWLFMDNDGVLTIDHNTLRGTYDYIVCENFEQFGPSQENIEELFKRYLGEPVQQYGENDEEYNERCDEYKEQCDGGIVNGACWDWWRNGVYDEDVDLYNELYSDLVEMLAWVDDDVDVVIDKNEDE